jgi:hypothetical protein
MTAVGDPRATIGELRDQLKGLVDSIAGYAPPPKPDRFERRDPQKIGPEWGALDRLVRVIDGETGVVFVEGSSYLYEGDMEALTTQEARALAMALLAAADWADGYDPLGQKRARTAAEHDA